MHVLKRRTQRNERGQHEGSGFHGIGDIRLDEVPEPTIQGPTGAIVRITASAICGTGLPGGAAGLGERRRSSRRTRDAVPRLKAESPVRLCAHGSISMNRPPILRHRKHGSER